MPEADVSNVGMKRKRGRPRKDQAASPPVAEESASTIGTVQEHPGAAHAQQASSPKLTGDTATKRKRGRPRKRVLEPHEEIALIAAKQSSSIPPWTVMAAVDRPPIYPETHIFLKTVQRARPKDIWDSPERTKPAPPRWRHYRRPTLLRVPARRADGITAEPLPVPPPGRRPRTRLDYTGLQHAQMAHRARGKQLDLRALWQARVARARAEPSPATNQLPPADAAALALDTSRDSTTSVVES